MPVGQAAAWCPWPKAKAKAKAKAKGKAKAKAAGQAATGSKRKVLALTNGEGSEQEAEEPGEEPGEEQESAGAPKKKAKGGKPGEREHQAMLMWLNYRACPVRNKKGVQRDEAQQALQD